MIALKELKLINFRSWKELHIKDFNKKGLCLISGVNGSGKSSIRMAIEYLILDKTSDGISVEDMPRDTTESCTILGKFELDGKDVSITKYRNHDKYQNQTHVDYDGDTSLTTNDRRVTQKNIEELFKITPSLLFTSTIFTVGSPSFVESLEADRKKLLYNILPLDVYNELYLVTTGQVKLITSKIENAEVDIKYITKSLERINDELIELRGKKDTYHDVIRDEIKQLRGQQDICKPEKFDDIENTITTLTGKLVEVDREFEQLLLKKRGRLQTKFSTLEQDLRYVKNKLEDVSDGTCPVLNIKCKDLLNQSEETKLSCEQDYEVIEHELSELSIRMQTMDKDLDEIYQDTEYNKSITHKIQLSERQIERIKQDNSYKKKQYLELEDRIFNLGNKDNPFQELIKEKEEEFKAEEKRLVEQKETVIVLRNEIEYLKYFETAFSKAGIPNMKADGLLESIEQETNRYLSSVSNRLFVEITGQTVVGNNLREKIAYKVKHPDKSITNYKSFSGGEKQRVKVADLFAFHSLLSKFNFIFLDEVLEGSIDNKGKVEVLTLLKMKAKEVDSLLVVSHDDTIKDAFDNVMNVKNVNGISTLE